MRRRCRYRRQAPHGPRKPRQRAQDRHERQGADTEGGPAGGTHLSFLVC
jgi:hypothetical protein